MIGVSTVGVPEVIVKTSGEKPPWTGFRMPKPAVVDEAVTVARS